MKTTEKLFKNPSSRFLEVECKNCHNKQIIFNKATSIVKCNNCGKVLATPTSSKSKILTKIVCVGDENNDLHSLLSVQNSESKTATAGKSIFNSNVRQHALQKKVKTPSSAKVLANKEQKPKASKSKDVNKS